MHAERIPASLCDLKRWVLWRFVVREGKRTKAPYQPSGRPAKSNSPVTWTHLDVALEALQRGGFDGLGFVLGDGITGIDLDWKGYAGEGVPVEAQTVVDRLNSYTEWSPSHKGCHILLMGSLPAGARNRYHLAPGVELEVYDRGRFFTVTAEPWAGYPTDLEDRQAELAALLADLAPPAPEPERKPTSAPVDLSDADLLERMFAAKNGAEIRRLWNGNITGYPSHSEADLALAGHLMWWCNNDQTRADRLFRQSGLYRDKWDERHFADGKTYGEATLERARAAGGYTPGLVAHGRLAGGGEGGHEESRPPAEEETAARVLLRLALEGADLWRDGEGVAWATLRLDDHAENWPVRSKAFKLWLSRLYYEERGKPPNSQALQDSLGVIEAKALFGEAEHPVHLRVAHESSAVWLDLGRPDWRAVRITPEGWSVQHPEVRFRRSKATGVLPVPEPGGVDALKALLEPWALDDSQKPLILAWLLGTLSAGPYPLLALSGEQGSGKSTLARTLQRLIDPSGDVASLPRESRELFISAKHSHILAFDNVSGIPNWLSDDLCKLATGGTLRLRELYTNDEEVFLQAKRPVILNGITDYLVRQDLIDRSIVLHLPQLEQHQPEAELWTAFHQLHPRALGGLLDLVALALKELPRTRTPNVRMADFARWALAAESGYAAPGTFEPAFAQMRQDTVLVALDSEPLYPLLLRLLEQGRFEGSAGELLEKLNELRGDGKPPEGWPRTPHSMASWLKRMSPALRKVGVRVDPLPRDRDKRRWGIDRMGGTNVTNVTDVTTPVQNAKNGVTFAPPRDISNVTPPPTNVTRGIPSRSHR